MKPITETEILQAEVEGYKHRICNLRSALYDVEDATNSAAWLWFICFVVMVIFHWGYK